MLFTDNIAYGVLFVMVHLKTFDVFDTVFFSLKTIFRKWKSFIGGTTVVANCNGII